MELAATHSSLADILHVLAQGLLVPDIILLLAFAGYALFCIGSIIVEFFTERRNFRTQMPKFLAALMAADEESIPDVVTKSGLLNRQKIALLTVFDYRTLPGDALVALIRRTVDVEETRYDRITGRNNTASRIAPMLGLMGTLIPLGPGVAALGEANTEILSSSLLVAFDTTVAGLVVAAICLAVGKIRGNWYGDYLSALDSGMATMLQKIELMREEGLITVTEPTDYAFIYEKSLSAEKAGGKHVGSAAAAAQVAEDVAEEAGIDTAAREDLADREDEAPATAAADEQRPYDSGRPLSFPAELDAPVAPAPGEAPDTASHLQTPLSSVEPARERADSPWSSPAGTREQHRPSADPVFNKHARTPGGSNSEFNSSDWL